MDAPPWSAEGFCVTSTSAAAGVGASQVAPATSDVGETSKLTIRNCGPIGLRLQEHPSGRGVCVAHIDPKSHPAMYGCDDGVEVAVGMHIVAINEHNVSTYAFDTAMAVLRSVAQQTILWTILFRVDQSSAKVYYTKSETGTELARHSSENTL